MGFYNERLAIYEASKKDVSLNERMIASKKVIDDKLSKEYWDLQNLYESQLKYPSMQMGIPSVAQRIATNPVVSELAIKRQEMHLVQSLTPQEYFENAVTKEGRELLAYKFTRLNELKETEKQFSSKVYRIKGPISFLKALTSSSSKQHLLSDINLLSNQSNVGSEACYEWARLSHQEKLAYVVGRYEFSGVTSFEEGLLDEEGYNRMVESEGKSHGTSYQITPTTKPEDEHLESEKLEVNAEIAEVTESSLAENSDKEISHEDEGIEIIIPYEENDPTKHFSQIPVEDTQGQ